MSKVATHEQKWRAGHHQIVPTNGMLIDPPDHSMHCICSCMHRAASNLTVLCAPACAQLTLQQTPNKQCTVVSGGKGIQQKRDEGSVQLPVPGVSSVHTVSEAQPNGHVMQPGQHSEQAISTQKQRHATAAAAPQLKAATAVDISAAVADASAAGDNRISAQHVIAQSSPAASKPTDVSDQPGSHAGSHTIPGQAAQQAQHARLKLSEQGQVAASSQPDAAAASAAAAASSHAPSGAIRSAQQHTYTVAELGKASTAGGSQSMGAVQVSSIFAQWCSQVHRKSVCNVGNMLQIYSNKSGQCQHIVKIPSADTTAVMKKHTISNTFA